LEKQFTDEQLRNIAIEFDGEDFLRELDSHEIMEEQFTDRILVDKNAGRDGATIVSEDDMSFQEDIGQTHLFSQTIHNPIVMEK